MKACALWAPTLPTLVFSSAAGHALVVRLFDTHSERHALLAMVSADYLEYVHLAAALCLALAALAFVQRALASSRHGVPLPLPSWRLAPIPALVLLVQEHLEKFVNDGELNLLTAAEPAVLVGVLLQLPCGLLTLWLVRALLRAADQLGSMLARGTERRAAHGTRQSRHCSQAAPFRRLALARGVAERAPPAFA
jgi:hypothetical protein